MAVDLVFVVIATLFISFLFAVAGWQKLRAPRYYASVIREYQLPLLAGNKAMAIAIGLSELCTGFLFLVPASREWAAWFAFMLLLIYAMAIGINLLRGRTSIDCGCSGPAAAKQKLSTWLLLRNGLLMVVAITAGMTPFSRELIWFDMVVIVLAASLAFLIYAGTEQLIANSTRLRNLRG